MFYKAFFSWPIYFFGTQQIAWVKRERVKPFLPLWQNKERYLEVVSEAEKTILRKGKSEVYQDKCEDFKTAFLQAKEGFEITCQLRKTRRKIQIHVVFFSKWRKGG